MIQRALSATIILMFAATFAFAQKGTPSEQRECYRQAHQYVAERRASGGEDWKLEQIHYEAKNRTCYVEMGLSEPLLSDDGTGRVLNTVTVDDAYEGKTVALCAYLSSESGSLFGVMSDGCYVGEKPAKSVAHWNYLLWKILPAFKPVK
jgi:hypothetical protein